LKIGQHLMKSYIRRTKEVCLFLDYPVDQASYEIDRITLQCGQNEWNITGVVTVNMMSLTHFLALTCCASGPIGTLAHFQGHDTGTCRKVPVYGRVQHQNTTSDSTVQYLPGVRLTQTFTGWPKK